MREPKRDRAALSRALRRYGQAPLVDRILVRGRAFLSDLAFIELFAPRRGFVVDLGCGHGLFANVLREASEDRRVLGVDADEHKIAIANLTEREGLRFEVGEIVSTPPPPCDALTIIDVLYLMPEEAQEQLIASCGRTLQEGRTLLVYGQEARIDPRYVLGYAQEVVATSLGFTIGAGGRLHYRSRDDMVAMLRRHGFVTDVVSVPRRPYTDTLYVARRVPQ